MTSTRAAVVEAGGAPFTLSDVELDELRESEVLIRMTAAGLCHTDLGVASGGLPFPLPGVLGHEGAGIVEQVGRAVTAIQPGDHVILSFTSCGTCANCRDGHPAYCATWLPSNLIGGKRPDGSATLRRDGQPLGGHFFGQSSFSERAIADVRSVIKIDPGVPLELVAPLGCGVQTGVGAVWNVLAPRPGSTLVVLGAGAVGLSAVMAAAMSPAVRIIAVDPVAERLELARELGATDTIEAGAGSLAEVIGELTSGASADGVVETTGSTAVLRQGVDALAARGTLVIVGAPPFGSEVSVDVNAMLAGRAVVGLTLGDSETQTLIPALVSLVGQGRLPVGRLDHGIRIRGHRPGGAGHVRQPRPSSPSCGSKPRLKPPPSPAPASGRSCCGHRRENIMNLSGKVAIVTGGGRGLGLAYAQALASAGAAVVINDADQAAADAAVALVTGAGGQAVAHVAAVGPSAVADALVDQAVSAFGRLDILVTNAGVLRDTVLWKMTDEQFDLVLDVHVRGTFTCARSAAIRFREQGDGGRIICIGSPTGQVGNFGQTNYAAAKAGIVGMVRTWSMELARASVTVNAVIPVAVNRNDRDRPVP